MSALHTVVLVPSQSVVQYLDFSVQNNDSLKRIFERASLAILFSLGIIDFVACSILHDRYCREDRFYILHRNHFCAKISQLFFVVLGTMCLLQIFIARHDPSQLPMTKKMALYSAFHIVSFVLFYKRL